MTSACRKGCDCQSCQIERLKERLTQAEKQANTLYVMLVTAHGQLVFMGRFYQPVYEAIQGYIEWRTAQAEPERQPEGGEK